MEEISKQLARLLEIDEPVSRHQVMLDKTTIKVAKRLGRGNVSKGLRIGMKAHQPIRRD